MMRRAVLAAAVILALLPAAALAAAGETEIQIPAVEYDLAEWQRIYDSLPAEQQRMLGGGVRELIEKYMNYSGGALLDVSAAKRVLGEAFALDVGRLMTVVGVAFLCTAAEIAVGGGKSGVSEILVFAMCGLCIATITAAIKAQFAIACAAVNGIAGVTEAAAPVLTLLLCACGAPTAGAVVQPMAILLCELISAVFSGFLMPLTLLLCVFGVTAALTGQPQLEGAAALIKTILKWSIGICAAFFLGSLSIRGINAAGVDGAGVKALKYAFDRSIPLVGGLVSGSYESLRAGAVLLKNAAGTAAALLAFAVIFAPSARLMGMVMALRVVAAICTAADGRISRMLSSAADGCTYMFAVTAAVGVMYMVMMAAVLLAGAA